MSDRDTTTGRPTVAVVAQWQRDTDHGKVPITYVHAVSLAGGRPRVITTFDIPEAPETPEEIEVIGPVAVDDVSGLQEVSGLIVPGGGDIDPTWYGQEPHPRTHAVNHRRDEFERNLINEALRRDLPMLAICHGMQLLNVVLGGTLEQHLADEADRLDHDRDRPRAEPVHGVSITERGILCDVFGTGEIPVNSHHHQGLGVVPEELRKVAWAGDGVLEAVESDRHSWVVGVQWHPEAMAPVDRRQLSIFEAFVRAADAYAARNETEARSA